jgi:hypothetical protein
VRAVGGPVDPALLPDTAQFRRCAASLSHSRADRGRPGQFTWAARDGAMASDASLSFCRNYFCVLRES